MADENDTTSEVARVLVKHQVLEPDFDDGGSSWICECGVRVHTGTQPDAWVPFAGHQAAMLAEAGLLRDYAVNAHESCNRELGNALGMAEKAQQWPFKPGAVLHWPEDPQTVVDALEAAPQGTLVSDADGCEFVRYEGEWCHGEAWRMTSVRLAQRGPLTVISVGEGS